MKWQIVFTVVFLAAIDISPIHSYTIVEKNDSKETLDSSAETEADNNSLEGGQETLDLWDGAIESSPPNPTSNRVGAVYWIGVPVPYELSTIFESRLSPSKFFTDAGERALIFQAIRNIEQNSCIKFIPRTKQRNFIFIRRNAPTCYSYIGRIGGRQDLNLGLICMKSGIIQHELLHALGFIHEHARAERDSWVRINWQNIKAGLSSQFTRQGRGFANYYGTYDYGSVMHYSRYSFTKALWNETISPKTPGVHIGQKVGMTALDFAKLNSAYKCAAAA